MGCMFILCLRMAEMMGDENGQPVYRQWNNLRGRTIAYGSDGAVL